MLLELPAFATNLPGPTRGWCQHPPADRRARRPRCAAKFAQISATSSYYLAADSLATLSMIVAHSARPRLLLHNREDVFHVRFDELKRVDPSGQCWRVRSTGSR